VPSSSTRVIKAQSAESFCAALKNEMYYRRSWPTRARARFAVAEYIEVFYNRRRLPSTLAARMKAARNQGRFTWSATKAPSPSAAHFSNAVWQASVPKPDVIPA
jgi:hypothetical protein